MSEIEKLYENTGVNKFGKRSCTTCEYLDCQNYCFISENNKCTKFNYDYPPFTAEKQLELIKWLGELDLLDIMRTIRDTKEWIINSEYGMSGNVYKHASRAKTFEETLAKLINSLWQDLTDTEKEQIKEILK